MRIEKNNIKSNHTQILHYIGYSKKNAVDQQTQIEIKEGIELIKKYSQPKYLFKKYNMFKIVNDTIQLDNHFIIKSNDLSNHLKDSKSIVIMAVTLGMTVDQLIKKEMLTNPSKGIILDAIASDFIEKCANETCKKIIKKSEKYRNPRFSPGYGDLSLEAQDKIIKALDTERKIGLFSNESFLLLPSKSITAFFGLFDTKKMLRKTCKNCQFLKTCRYREEGVFCYDQSIEE